MRIIVEVEDFWMDEDSDEFENEFKNYVKGETKKEIWATIEERINKEIIKQVTEIVNKNIEKKVAKFIDKMLNSGELKVSGRYSDDKPKDMKEYIIDKLKSDNTYGTPKKMIEELSEKYAKEFRNRYDLLFASQLVAKLGNNGLLREDIARLLLPTNQKGEKDN